MKNHGWELAALWSLAMSIVGSMVWLALSANGDLSSIHGTVITALSPVLPMAFNSIRNIGQSRAMQSMADQLGKSAPVQEQATGRADDPVHVTPEGPAE